MVGQKRLSVKEYEKFEREYSELKISTYSDKDSKLNRLYDEYERDLKYVGSTAIEDKLQYGVPEAIYTLIQTRIKVWVLTGDKQETAIEIGKSCKLIQPDMDLEILTSSSSEEFKEKLLTLCKKYNIILGKKVTNLEKVREL